MNLPKFMVTFLTGAVFCSSLSHAQDGQKTHEQAESGAVPAPTAEPVSDRSSSVVLWDIRGHQVETFEKELASVLASETANHLVNSEQFQRYVEDHPSSISGCFLGLDHCASSRTLVFDALGLAMVIQLDLAPRAIGEGREVYQAEYRTFDRGGKPIRSSLLVQPDQQRLADHVVRDIFDATGILAIESNPSGAAVWIDHIRVGTTPLEKRLPIGTYQVDLKLQGHHPIRTTSRIPNGSSARSRFRLEELSGTLEIRGLPADTEILINDATPVISVEREPTLFPLQPGNYVVTVQKKGYTTQQLEVAVTAGETTLHAVALEKQITLLKEFNVPLESYPYAVKLGYEHLIETGTHRDARTTEPSALEFVGFARPNAGDPLTEIGLGGNGLRLDLSYWGPRWGLVALSLSYHGTTASEAGVVVNEAGQEIPVTLEAVDRLQIRPLHLAARFPIRNLVPVVEAGLGLEISWLQISSPRWQEPVRLRATQSMLSVGAGMEYYFAPQWLGWVRYGFQGYLDVGDELDHLISLGFGTTFRSLYMLEDRPPEKL
jgi:hypothetical protein